MAIKSASVIHVQLKKILKLFSDGQWNESTSLVPGVLGFFNLSATASLICIFCAIRRIFALYYYVRGTFHLTPFDTLLFYTSFIRPILLIQLNQAKIFQEKKQ